MWDPGQYQRYADERGRSFLELLARVGAEDPRYVVDLGCGPGNLTATLLTRWPDAAVEGVDSSPEMIEAARAHAVPGRLGFSLGDLRDWRPPRQADVIVANAVLQWIPEHRDLLPRLVAMLAPAGWLAFQVPGNYGAPDHVILHELCESPRWRERLGGVPRPDVAEPEEYVERITGLGCAVDAWETTYLHLLTGDDPVLEWMRGTALRPVFAALDRTEREEFVAEYAERLRAAFPSRWYGTVLRFRRVFVVVRAGA
ncbi:MAG: trans-aconitate 2-methyltransferase [Streptosporangiales bacterium]|nr:trans-aconitate 2-methyltransferase [Streptosporangiales bacterium]